MTLPNDPRDPSYDEPVNGEPLDVPPVGADATDATGAPIPPGGPMATGAPMAMGGPIDPIAPAEPIAPAATAQTVQPVEPVEPTPAPSEQAEESEGGKLKGAALLAGAAALANKVRQEAPKKVHELREKRAAGRCVILTEADGRALAIGPYKNDEAARQDVFKVGGAPRVVELVSEAAFFAPHETPGS